MSANRMKNEWKYNESRRTPPGAFITSNTILKDRDENITELWSVFGTEAYRSIEFSLSTIMLCERVFIFIERK